MKERKKESEWDKKKIVLFVAGLVLLISAGLIFRKMMVAGQDTQTGKSPTAVKGVSVESVPSLPDIKQNIQNQVNNLKNEAQNINVVDIATSSPQVQKVINDLKAIQDYPKNQLRQTCEKICSGL
jgi:conjugal transfer/entry exclusion protein